MFKIFIILQLTIKIMYVVSQNPKLPTRESIKKKIGIRRFYIRFLTISSLISYSFFEAFENVNFSSKILSNC